MTPSQKRGDEYKATAATAQTRRRGKRGGGYIYIYIYIYGHLPFVMVNLVCIMPSRHRIRNLRKSFIGLLLTF